MTLGSSALTPPECWDVRDAAELLPAREISADGGAVAVQEYVERFDQHRHGADFLVHYTAGDVLGFGE